MVLSDTDIQTLRERFTPQVADPCPVCGLTRVVVRDMGQFNEWQCPPYDVDPGDATILNMRPGRTVELTIEEKSHRTRSTTRTRTKTTDPLVVEALVALRDYFQEMQFYALGTNYQGGAGSPIAADLGARARAVRQLHFGP